MAMKLRFKIKNTSQRYDINWLRARHGHKYTKYKMCLSIIMAIYNKQHLNNTWSWIHEKVKQHQHWGWVEKSIACKKKACICFLGPILSIYKR